MEISYDIFTLAFLSKISEYNFIQLEDEDRTSIVDGYMKRAINTFKNVCEYDLVSTGDDELRLFTVDIPQEDLSELVDIISDGMVVQWLKQYVNNQDLLENVLNTRDYTTYSAAELLLRVGDTHQKALKHYVQAVREYSYNHGSLSDLHL